MWENRLPMVIIDKSRRNVTSFDGIAVFGGTQIHDSFGCREVAVTSSKNAPPPPFYTNEIILM